ncbi:MAG: hypothetical protein JWO67_6302 [Streptosporangiaceae bacterium]|nr:hypothetical protein [Streptosporangiaceae bacterium]
MTAIEPGRYVCVKTKGFIPWIIRRATKSDYDHVFIVGYGGQIIQAESGGVQIAALSGYAGAELVANVAEPMTDVQRAAVVAAARALVGDEYNFATIVDQGFTYLGLHWRLLLRLASAKRVFDCSQLVVVCGADAQPPMAWMCGRSNTALVTPADLARRPGVVPVVLA